MKNKVIINFFVLNYFTFVNITEFWKENNGERRK